jgi:hypothetical protein
MKSLPQVRRNLPNRIRHALRLGRHLVISGQTSKPLPGDLLADCRMCASRNDLVEALPRGGRIAEIGTYKGHFARHILATCNPAGDLDSSLLEPILEQDARVQLHRGLSHDVAWRCFRMRILIGCTSTRTTPMQVTRDANAAASKVKPGGFLVFNDFAHMDPFLGAYGSASRGRRLRRGPKVGIYLVCLRSYGALRCRASAPSSLKLVKAWRRPPFR